MTTINGLERVIDYTPIIRADAYDIDNFYFPIRPVDTLFAVTVNNSTLKNKQNKPINAIGKMLVVNSSIQVKLADLLGNLEYLSIKFTIIFSINLRDDIEEEMFSIKSGEFSVVYIEIGINYFIDTLNEDPSRYVGLNKNILYIFRNATYFDINYILSQAGEYGINLGRGSGQKSHNVSPLELRFMSYLMAISNFNYSFIYEINHFNTLPKSRYLPFYK